MTADRQSRGWFITGTDTGVGKTVVAAALLALLRGRGVDAVPMKPIQTGCTRRGRRLVAPDLAFCLRIAGLAETMAMCPYRFVPACSPHLAAQRARRPIDLDRIRQAYDRLAARHAFVLVEGAGGVLAPVRGRRTMRDVMVRIGLPVLLVARPGLGTINHTLLALAALRAAGLRVAGVFLAATTPAAWGRIERDNAATIARLGRVRVLGRLPFLAGLDEQVAPRAFGAAVARFSKHWKVGPPVFPRIGK